MGDSSFDELQTHYVLGKAKFAEKNYEEASAHLQRFAEKHENFADVWFMLGAIHHALGRFSEAIDSFEKALTINPHYMEAALNLAVTYNDVGQYEKGAKTYQMAMEAAKAGGMANLDPLVLARLANMHADLGDVYRSIDRSVDAIEQYAKAVELRPQFVDIQTKLGMALRESGDLHGSVDQLRKAVQTNPNYPAAKIHLGISLYALGKLPEAIAVWDEILEKIPNHKEARLYKSMAEKNLAKS